VADVNCGLAIIWNIELSTSAKASTFAKAAADKTADSQEYWNDVPGGRDFGEPSDCHADGMSRHLASRFPPTIPAFHHSIIPLLR
jgi:hypothetical protein